MGCFEYFSSTEDCSLASGEGQRKREEFMCSRLLLPRNTTTTPARSAFTMPLSPGKASPHTSPISSARPPNLGSRKPAFHAQAQFGASKLTCLALFVLLFPTEDRVLPYFGMVQTEHDDFVPQSHWTGAGNFTNKIEMPYLSSWHAS